MNYNSRLTSSNFNFFSQSWCWNISYSDQFICQCSENFLTACCVSYENCNVDLLSKITQWEIFPSSHVVRLSHIPVIIMKALSFSLFAEYMWCNTGVIEVPFLFPLSFRILNFLVSKTIFFSIFFALDNCYMFSFYL